jgi:hypothetical protein
VMALFGGFGPACSPRDRHDRIMAITRDIAMSMRDPVRAFTG